MRLIHLFVCIASFIFFVPISWSQPQNPKQQEEAKKFVEKGAALYEQGKIKQALDAYKKANELSPESPGPYREIGRCYRDLKQHEQAFHYLSEYLSRKPTNEYRDGILKYMEEQRPLLSKKDKSLLTLNSDPQGATVFVIDSKGQATGIGVTPIKEHPIPSDTVSVRFSGTPFEIFEEKIDASKPTIELTSIIDPEKRPKVVEVPVVIPPKAEPAKRTKAFVFFGAGVACVAGSLVMGDQFNKSVEALDQKQSDDPGVDQLFRLVVTEAISSDALGAIAVGAGVLGIVQLRKVKKLNKEKAATTVLIAPTGVALSGSF
jgi:tetratricopeptide (TPR) repeat protein